MFRACHTTVTTSKLQQRQSEQERKKSRNFIGDNVSHNEGFCPTISHLKKKQSKKKTGLFHILPLMKTILLSPKAEKKVPFISKHQTNF